VNVGVGRIGCTPYALAMNNRTNGSCVEEMNAATSMNAPCTVSGFTVTNASCCPTGTDVLCVPNQTLCQNRSQYVF